MISFIIICEATVSNVLFLSHKLLFGLLVRRLQPTYSVLEVSVGNRTPCLGRLEKAYMYQREAELRTIIPVDKQ